MKLCQALRRLNISDRLKVAGSGMAALLAVVPLPLLAQDERPVATDLAVELRMKIEAPFTLAAVGDILQMRPVSMRSDPAIRAWIELVTSADVAVANMESTMADLSDLNVPNKGFVGDKSVAADIKAMGFDLLNRANNWNRVDVMESTNIALDEQGLVHAGDGRNLQEARAPRYLETPMGRFGILGVSGIGHRITGPAASYAVGGSAGQAGVNPLRLRAYAVVPQSAIEAMREWRDTILARRSDVTNPVALPNDISGKEIDFFNGRYTSVGTPGDWAYKVDPLDLRENLRAIREGKLYSDYMVVNFHTHEERNVLQRPNFSYDPPDFLVDFAHQAIDNGADIFLTTGQHVVSGIEIYNGKPIFYGLSHFIYQLPMLTPDVPSPTLQDSDDLTRAELARRMVNYVQQPDNMESVLVTVKYSKGALKEIRVYPMDLLDGAPISRKSVPRLATGSFATEVLEKVRARSERFGTRMRIEKGVGIISVVDQQ